MDIIHHKKYFEIVTKKLSDGSVLHVVDIKEIRPNLKELIDENLTKIHSAGKYDLRITKKILRTAFNVDQIPRVVSNVKMGAIAEFFIHLYFTQIGFRQECLFKNLEELYSIKKGHDGYYSFNEEEWLMESKSTRSRSTHKDNIKKAYDDLSDKVSGKKRNAAGKVISPWDNALNHAKQADSSKGILDNIKKLSVDFIDSKFSDIGQFNIIPASTIFLEDEWKSFDPILLQSEIDDYIKDKDYKKINIICVTKSTVDLFLDYLKE